MDVIGLTACMNGMQPSALWRPAHLVLAFPCALLLLRQQQLCPSVWAVQACIYLWAGRGGMSKGQVACYF